MMATDGNGNIITPANTGWKCSEGDIDDTGFVDLTYTGSGNFSNATNISMFGFKLTVASLGSSAVFTNFAGLLTWCKFVFASTSTAGLGLSCSTTTGGIVNCQVAVTGTAWARLISGSTGGLMSNIRIKGASGATTGTRYGLTANTSSLIGVGNGPLFICDCPGYGIVNYSTGVSAGYQASRLTIVNCGTGIGTLCATSGGSSKLNITDAVITGCTVGLEHAYGIYSLSNVVLRNTTNFSVASENYVGAPAAIITTEVDADLYNNSAAGDYRIKNTSAHWGLNRGAQDAPAAAGGDYTYAQVKQFKYKMRQGALT